MGRQSRAKARRRGCPETRAIKLDRAFFNTHPNQAMRARPLIPGEFDPATETKLHDTRDQQARILRVDPTILPLFVMVFRDPNSRDHYRTGHVGVPREELLRPTPPPPDGEATA